MLSWTLLAALVVAGLVIWFWQDSLKARERANIAAQEACERAGLQFLDGTVAFAGLRFSRDRGRAGFRRTYVFDYTSRAIERLQGFVVLQHGRVESIGFAQETTLTVEPSPAPRATQEQRPSQHGNVLDLEQWRRQRRANGSHDNIRRSEPGDRHG